MGGRQYYNHELMPTVEWWAVLAHNNDIFKLKSDYLQELQMISVILSMIASFTYPMLFINLGEFKSVLSELETDCLTITFFITFSLTLMSLSFVILVYVQLNIRQSSVEVIDFFTNSSTNYYPQLQSQLTQASLILCTLTSAAWSWCAHTVRVRTFVLCIGSAGVAIVYFVYFTLDSCLNAELSRLLVEINKRKNEELVLYLESHGLQDYIFNIIPHVRTVSELGEAVELLEVLCRI